MRSGKAVIDHESWAAMARALAATPGPGEGTGTRAAVLGDWMKHGASRGFDWRATYENIRNRSMGPLLPDPDVLEQSIAESSSIYRLVTSLLELRDYCARAATILGDTLGAHVARGEAIQLTRAVSALAGLRDADVERVRTILLRLQLCGASSRTALAGITAHWSGGSEDGTP